MVGRNRKRLKAETGIEPPVPSKFPRKKRIRPRQKKVRKDFMERLDRRVVNPYYCGHKTPFDTCYYPSFHQEFNEKTVPSMDNQLSNIKSNSRFLHYYTFKEWIPQYERLSRHTELFEFVASVYTYSEPCPVRYTILPKLPLESELDRSVYLDNLPINCTRQKLLKLLRKFGNVVQLRFPQKRRYENKEGHYGHATVFFCISDSAEEMVKKYAGNKLGSPPVPTPIRLIRELRRWRTIRRHQRGRLKKHQIVRLNKVRRTFRRIKKHHLMVTKQMGEEIARAPSNNVSLEAHGLSSGEMRRPFIYWDAADQSSSLKTVNLSSLSAPQLNVSKEDSSSLSPASIQVQIGSSGPASPENEENLASFAFQQNESQMAGPSAEGNISKEEMIKKKKLNPIERGKRRNAKIQSMGWKKWKKQKARAKHKRKLKRQALFIRRKEARRNHIGENKPKRLRKRWRPRNRGYIKPDYLHCSIDEYFEKIRVFSYAEFVRLRCEYHEIQSKLKSDFAARLQNFGHEGHLLDNASYKAANYLLNKCREADFLGLRRFEPSFFENFKTEAPSKPRIRWSSNSPFSIAPSPSNSRQINAQDDF